MKRNHRIIGLTLVFSLLILLVGTIANVTATDGGYSIDGYDRSAPEITFNVTDFKATGLIYGSISEKQSNLETYDFYHIVENNTHTISETIIGSVSVNTTDCNITIIDSKTIEFVIHDEIFEVGYHNWIIIEATNDNFPISPMPSINQPGGGGGGFFFCDDADCWGPMPLQPKNSERIKTSPISKSVITDPNAPIILFNLTGYCCAIDPTPMTSPNINIDPNSIIIEAIGDGYESEAKDIVNGITYKVTLQFGELVYPPVAWKYIVGIGVPAVIIIVAGGGIYYRRKRRMNKT
jgi:hypothetical protein